MLSPKYQWLLKQKHPQILVQAVSLYGTLETPGNEDNPVILGWAKEVGGKTFLDYRNDSTPWCGLFMAVCVKRAGLEPINAPLWALSWSNWGMPSRTPMLGDVLVFKRDGGGHVGLYVGEDKDAYHVLGGNQSDAVNIMRISKSRLHAARRTRWTIKQPKNVQQVFLSNAGGLSMNEL